MHIRHRNAPDPAPEEAPQIIATIDASQLSGLFSAPQWLRDLGLMTWLLVGIGLVLVGLVWLLGLTASITIPVILGLVIAAVSSPAVDALQRRKVPRAAGAGIVLLGVVAIGVVIAVLVFAGLASQSGAIDAAIAEAMAKIQGWLSDLGVNSGDAAQVIADIKKAVPSIGTTLLTGVADGISGLTSLFFTLSFAIFATFFLLKDGPSMHGWVDSHIGLPEKVAGVVTGETLRALRRAFAVLLALAGVGESAAVAMIVIVALANGLLQQIVQPIAFGATLGLNPLVVLIVTIAGGSLFGMIGLVLGAPLTSAASHIAQRLGAERGAQDEQAEDTQPAPPAMATPAPQPG